jgi:riboflavin biosynthesis pyrimidine reductase
MGADVGRQFLDAGAIDEISVHVVPVLFGSGTPLFGEGVDEHITLELVSVSESEHAAHLRYRVVREG